MATLTPTRHPADRLGPDPGFAVVRAGPRERPGAVARLLGIDPRDDGAVQAFLRQAEVEGTDLSRLWASVRGYRPGIDIGPAQITQACLASINPGRTAVLLISSGPAPTGLAGEQARAKAERTAVVRQACEGLTNPAAAGLDPAEVVLAQSLTEPDDLDLIASLQDAGFLRLADLAYMRRPIPRGSAATKLQPRFPAGVEVVTLDRFAPAQADELLRQALDTSYEGTLDCPDLCGMRTTDDVLQSHKAVGEHDPRLWFVVMIGGNPVGCMLLSCGAGPETAELVYLGLGPLARGKGIAGALLDLGLQRLGSRSEATLACAVDTRNTPALRLYRRARFKRFATRVALVRSLRAIGKR